jgi:2-polyprenyl-6-methoxyphenol hydroxylase-like FAD-dependent oxidoreductase
MGSRPLRVAVVGSGIGGLTAAIALRAKGFRVEVFDQANKLSEIGAGVSRRDRDRRSVAATLRGTAKGADPADPGGLARQRGLLPSARRSSGRRAQRPPALAAGNGRLIHGYDVYAI